MKIWFSKSGNKALRLFVFLIAYLLLFLHKHTKTSDPQETMKSCSRYEFFTSDFIETCEGIQSLITQLIINHYSISKLKYRNLNSFSHLLVLLSGDISLNPGPVHQDTLQCSNEWNVFKNRGLILFTLRLSYNILSVFPREVENISFEILLPNSKPIGTIYRPPNQSNFLEILNEI